MFHQQCCTSQSIFQRDNLLFIVTTFISTRLIRGQGIINLATGTQQFLLKCQGSFFLLRLGNTFLSNQCSSIK